MYYVSVYISISDGYFYTDTRGRKTGVLSGATVNPNTLVIPMRVRKASGLLFPRRVHKPDVPLPPVTGPIWPRPLPLLPDRP